MIAVVLSLLANGRDAAVAASGEQRLALLIGNGAYGAVDTLPNPVADVQLIRRELEAVGFEIISGTDLTAAQMRRTIAAFRQRLAALGEKAVGLFYYAGHGVQIDGINYLVPIDAVAVNEQSFVRDHAILASDVFEQIPGRQSGPRLNIIILDACRDNPFRKARLSASQQLRSHVGGGLARMDAPLGSYVAFSTEPGNVAVDGLGLNSPFASAFAQILPRRGLKLEDVFKEVRKQVHAATDGRQTPWDSSSIFGDFYFTAPPENGSEGATLLAFAMALANREAFEAVRQRFPGSEWSRKAEAEIARLPQEPPRVVPDQIARIASAQKAFAVAEKTGTVDAYRFFATLYPDSPLTDRALKQASALMEEQRRREEAAARLDGPVLVRGLQEQLLRVGCYGGTIDSVFGSATVAALRKFGWRSKERILWHRPSPEALTALKRAGNAVCTMACIPGQLGGPGCVIAVAADRVRCFNIGKERLCE